MQPIGKLLVIDGADGAGKATQTKLLVERLRSEGRVVETLAFPRYDDNAFGQLLRECLDGKRGDFSGLDPQIASVLYAADRYVARPQLESWLSAGSVVVLDRYVSANMLHQGSKIVGDQAALTEFLSWLDHVEHTLFGLPRPDLILYLDVPYSVRASLLVGDTLRSSIDTVETNTSYQMAAEACAQELLAGLNNWQRIACTEAGQLLPRDIIHDRVYAAIAGELA